MAVSDFLEFISMKTHAKLQDNVTLMLPTMSFLTGANAIELRATSENLCVSDAYKSLRSMLGIDLYRIMWSVTLRLRGNRS